MSAPIIVQMNPQGKWENSKPECLDEERLRAVIQHLVKSKAISAAQSYCCQCAAENKVLASVLLISEISIYCYPLTTEMGVAL